MNASIWVEMDLNVYRLVNLLAKRFEKFDLAPRFFFPDSSDVHSRFDNQLTAFYSRLLVAKLGVQ